MKRAVLYRAVLDALDALRFATHGPQTLPEKFVSQVRPRTQHTPKRFEISTSAAAAPVIETHSSALASLIVLLPALVQDVLNRPEPSDDAETPSIRMLFSDLLHQHLPLTAIPGAVRKLMEQTLADAKTKQELQHQLDEWRVLFEGIVRGLGDRATSGEQSGLWVTLPQSVFALRRGEQAFREILSLLKTTETGAYRMIERLMAQRTELQEQLKQAQTNPPQTPQVQEDLALLQEVRRLLGGIERTEIIPALKQLLALRQGVPPPRWPAPASDTKTFVSQLVDWLNLEGAR